MRIAILISLMCLAGCDVAASANKLTKTYYYNHIREVCIDGVIYLVYNSQYAGGITPKINAEHYPYTCPTVEK
ncbi:hypothetical protein [Conservatibacter flavescens]|uniref:Uncharacterized protein n=1 Tax=Conservatibacter flavescens TaxID=28161 RepID=A0A2M8S4X7_9PAST|nr:hypothetical protein [Conservatibacter flavescens]PJG86189.1 hypothetical protein CVP05_03190 [Conservatibacter flavescens]